MNCSTLYVFSQPMFPSFARTVLSHSLFLRRLRQRIPSLAQNDISSLTHEKSLRSWVRRSNIVIPDASIVVFIRETLLMQRYRKDDVLWVDCQRLSRTIIRVHFCKLLNGNSVWKNNLSVSWQVTVYFSFLEETSLLSMFHDNPVLVYSSFL